MLKSNDWKNCFMKHEILRYLLLVLPYVFCTTLASLIIWGEDIRRIFPRLIIYSLLASLTQTLTYQISLSEIQFLLEVISGFLVAYLVFKKKLLWIFKIYATSYILGIIYIVALITPATLLIFSQPFAELNENPVYWLTFCLPAYVLLVVIVYMIRKIGVRVPKLKIYLGSGLERPYPIFIAILIQLIVFTGFGGQILLEPGLVDYNSKVAVSLISSFFLVFISFYILIKYFQKRNLDLVISSQEAVSENIMELVNSVKGQRHDFMNHLQIIAGLFQLNKTEALSEYLGNLLEEVSLYNEILKIDNPIISALINAKVSQANLKGVNIKVYIQTTFSGFEIAAMNIARILANLIDNAIDAVLEDDVAKEVEIKIVEQGHLLVCMVNNHSTKTFDKDQIFIPGFTSKDEHSGLGLYNCRKLAAKLHGKLELVQDEGKVSFALLVPRKGSLLSTQTQIS